MGAIAEAATSLARNKEGYMVLAAAVSSGDWSAWECGKIEACPETHISASSDSCPTGTSGIGCSICGDDLYWSSNDGVCKDCFGSFGLYISFMIVAFLITIAAIYFFMLPSHPTFCVEMIH